MDHDDTIRLLREQLADAHKRIAELEGAIDASGLKAEGKHPSSERIVQALLSSSLHPIYLIDLSGTVLAVNRCGAARLGYEPSETLGRCLYDFFPPDLARKRRAYAEEVFRTGRPIHFEDQRDDIWFDSTLYPVSGEAGQTVSVLVYAVDITERKRAEEAIRKYSTDLRERLKELHCLYSISEIVRRDNASQEEILKECALVISQAYLFPEISACRITWGDHEYSTESFRKTMWSQHSPIMMHGEQTGSIEVCYLEERQKEFEGPFLVEERRLLNSVAELLGRSAERKEAEEKYRSIYENAVEGIYQTTPEGRYLSVNPAFARMHGFDSPEEMIEAVSDIGQQLYVNPEDRERIKRLLAEHGAVEGFETQLRRKDGGAFWASINARIVRDSAGNILYYEGTAEDITGRKRAEEALRESEERYRGIANNLPGIVFQAYSTDSGERGMYFVDERAEQVCGVRADPVRDWDRRFEACIAPEDKEKWLDSAAEAVRTSGPWDVEARFIKPTGEEMYIKGIARPRRLKDEMVWNGILLDITDRKHLEAQLRQAQNLESIGTLAGGIAHDFNNLLAVLAANVSLAKMYLSPSDEAFQLLAEAEGICLSGADVTKRLLTFSKGGAPVRKVLSINTLIRDRSNAALAGSNIRGEYSLSDDLLPVKVDEAQLGQAIQNIVLNAKEAMPSGGPIKVSSANIVLTPGDAFPLAPGDYVKITVEDQGTGIKGEDLPRIFDPYFTTKGMGAERGMGLGLTVVYSIIKRHNGHVAVESIPGKGTAVHVYLPAHKMDMETGETHREPSSVSQGKVLFMDDEKTMRDVSEKALDSLGYKVALAANGMEAIQLYKDALDSDEPFDAVILDLTVKKGMGGQETIRRLLDIDPHVKAIISSGYADDPVISSYADYGFKAVLTKPYKMDELKGILQRTIPDDTPGRSCAGCAPPAIQSEGNG